MVEHLTADQEVPGSSPGAPSFFIIPPGGWGGPRRGLPVKLALQQLQPGLQEAGPRDGARRGVVDGPVRELAGPALVPVAAEPPYLHGGG